MIANNRERAAYHEAGHAVALYLLTGNIDRIEEVNIGDAGYDYIGACQHSGEHRREIQELYENGESPKYETPEGFKCMINEICYAMAGGVSEKLFCGLKQLPYKAMKGDIESVYSDAFVIRYNIPFLIDSNNAVVPNKRIIDDLIKVCVRFLEYFLISADAGPKIEAIADALNKYEQIPQWGVYELMGDDKRARKSKIEARKRLKLLLSK